MNPGVCVVLLRILFSVRAATLEGPCWVAPTIARSLPASNALRGEDGLDCLHALKAAPTAGSLLQIGCAGGD